MCSGFTWVYCATLDNKGQPINLLVCFYQKHGLKRDGVLLHCSTKYENVYSVIRKLPRIYQETVKHSRLNKSCPWSSHILEVRKYFELLQAFAVFLNKCNFVTVLYESVQCTLVIIFFSMATYRLIPSLVGFHHQGFESVINEQRLKDRDETETGKVCDSILYITISWSHMYPYFSLLDNN